MRHRSPDGGQAAPLYITMVVLVLFLALAFFAVGQAGATRNGAQSAADSAALAAAQESRDQFEVDLLADLFKPGYLDDIFNGNPLGTSDGCEAAGYFAGQNGAEVQSCAALGGAWGFTVQVITLNSMGDSILPGTENKHGEAGATAVVESRCSFVAAEDPKRPPPDGVVAEPASPGDLECGDMNWHIEPGATVLPVDMDMADLFSVRLAQD